MNQKIEPTLRGRTRDDLVAECARILSCDSWDDNSVMNAAERLADLLREISGNTGQVRDGETSDERKQRVWQIAVQHGQQI